MLNIYRYNKHVNTKHVNKQDTLRFLKTKRWMEQHFLCKMTSLPLMNLLSALIRMTLMVDRRYNFHLTTGTLARQFLFLDADRSACVVLIWQVRTWALASQQIKADYPNRDSSKYPPVLTSTVADLTVDDYFKEINRHNYSKGIILQDTLRSRIIIKLTW